MLTVRKSDERGHADHGWLDARHSFSFADYHDPDFMGYRSLRVLNEDRVAAGQGFGMHAHRNMEIVTIVLEGALEHKDSIGNGAQMVPGDVQRMTAGSGVRHSEFNPSSSDSLHLLQIWLHPEADGLPPSYEQIKIIEEEKRDRLRLIASRDGSDGSLTIHQDARLYLADLSPGTTVGHRLDPGRGGWLQVIAGSVTVEGTPVSAGDAVIIEDVEDITVATDEGSKILLFDLA